MGRAGRFRRAGSASWTHNLSVLNTTLGDRKRQEDKRPSLCDVVDGRQLGVAAWPWAGGRDVRRVLAAARNRLGVTNGGVRGDGEG